MVRNDVQVGEDTIALARTAVRRRAAAAGWTPAELSDMLTMLGIDDMPARDGEAPDGQ